MPSPRCIHCGPVAPEHFRDEVHVPMQLTPPHAERIATALERIADVLARMGDPLPAKTSTPVANTAADFVLRSLRRAMEITARQPDPRGSDTIQSRTEVSVELLTPSIRSQLVAHRMITITAIAEFKGEIVSRWYLGTPTRGDAFSAIASGNDEAGLRACFGVS